MRLVQDYFGFKFYEKKDNIYLWVQGDRRLNKQLKEPMKCFFQVNLVSTLSKSDRSMHVEYFSKREVINIFNRSRSKKVDH